MDTTAAFDAIRKEISEGRVSDVAPKIREVASSTSDPFDHIKCISLLKVIDEESSVPFVIEQLMNNIPDDRKDIVEVAGALRGLGQPYESINVLSKLPDDDAKKRLQAMCQMDMEEYESALQTLTSIVQPEIHDRILLSETYSALGEHTQSIKVAEALLESDPSQYDVRRTYVSALLLSGKEKDATKYARSSLKDKSADSNAIAAYVMRVMGNYKAAGGYASRAVQLDNTHIGALETLGICLAYKGEIEKARIIAGAINEVSPGNKAAFTVLSYCESSP